jgi:hypothetical protein
MRPLAKRRYNLVVCLEDLMKTMNNLCKLSDSHSGGYGDVFCDVTPCSPMKVNRSFGGTYCLHLQNLRV